MCHAGGFGQLRPVDSAGCGADGQLPEVMAVGQLQRVLSAGSVVAAGVLHALPEGRWPLNA